MIKFQILLVEDDIHLADATKQLFEGAHQGSPVAYEVTIASDGNQALALWRERIYDLMIMDLVIPGRSGREVIEQIKQANPAMPIIIITGEGKMEDAVSAVNYHVFAYLKKPLKWPVLLEHVRNALSARPSNLIMMEKLAYRHPENILMHEGGKSYTAMELYQEMRRGGRRDFGKRILEGLDRLDIQLPELSVDELLGLKE